MKTTFTETEQSENYLEEELVVVDPNDDCEDEIESIARQLVANWQKGDWVAVLFESIWYPGIVEEVGILKLE